MQVVVDLGKLRAEAERQVSVDVLEEVVDCDVVRHSSMSEVVKHVQRLTLQPIKKMYDIMHVQ